MRFIPTKMHAMFDYLGGALLLIVPLFWLGDTSIPAAAIWTPVVLGGLMLGQSLITNYELSLASIVPVPAHLGIDAVAGLVLAASPWVFGFADVVWLPHLLFGLLEVGGALTTKLHREDYAHSGRGHSGVQGQAPT